MQCEVIHTRFKLFIGLYNFSSLMHCRDIQYLSWSHLPICYTFQPCQKA